MFLDKIPFFSDPEHRETTKTIFTRVVEEVTGGVVGWWRRMRAMVDGDEYIMVLGGDQHSASGEYSTVLGGLQAVADLYGQLVHANGSFSQAGQAQRAVLVCRNYTTSGVSVDLYLDGRTGSEKLKLKDKSAWAFKGVVVGLRMDGGGGDQEGAMWKIEGLIRKVELNSSTTLVASNVTLVGQDSGTTSWGGVSLSADTSAGALKITVTGVAGESVRWVGMLHYADIGSYAPV